MSKVRRRGPRRPTGLSVSTPRPLLERILDTPHLERVVPRMPPEILHRVIQTCGLEDCGELMALATPAQLSRVFDLDLWRAGQPGLDEQFDAARFGVWLEVLMAAGATVAAEKLAGLDIDLVTAGFAQHVRVFDPATLSVPEALEDDEVPDRPVHDGPSCELGGYLVVGRATDSWDAIVGALTALGGEHPQCFHRVMSGCRSLSNSAPEIDGLDDRLDAPAQTMFDLAIAREQRREQQGFVAPAQAQAFLQMARELPLGRHTTPPANPVARAYFQAIEWTDTLEATPDSDAAAEPADAVAAIVDILLEAGVLPPQPRALLDGPQGPAPRLNRIQTQMQIVGDRDLAAFARRGQELAFLANTIVAGCSIQARVFTAQEASDAAVATCNLGLENWPAHWLPPEAHGTLPDGFLVEHDLTSVFQVGWTILYRDVCLFAAEGLIKVLKPLRLDDRETQRAINTLRREMTIHLKAGTPWDARDALDVITSLDMPAWAALLGLIDECPVMHAGLRASAGAKTLAVSASAFEFISENSQIESVRAFVGALPDVLRG